jgi:hypothetical protein
MGMRIALDLRHSFYVPMAPHCQASPIGTMAA